MALTDEVQKEVDDKVKAGIEKAMADKKEAEDALAKQKADTDAEIEKRVKEATEKAGPVAVTAYKAEQALAAKRFDELNEILPYETEEEKVAERDKLSAMADERYDDYKEKRELLAKIAELTKGDAEEGSEEEGSEEGSEEGVDAGSGMPAGKISAAATKPQVTDLSALERM